MKKIISLIACSFLIACGDKDSDTGSEAEAAEETDTAEEQFNPQGGTGLQVPRFMIPLIW